MTSRAAEIGAGDVAAQLVAVGVGGQHFGLPILRVRDIFAVERLTPVPRAPRAVAGLCNLRGRVITVIDLRAVLGAPASSASGDRMCVGVEWNGEGHGLLVDEIGEVLSIDPDLQEPPPATLAPSLAAVSRCVHRLPDRLLIELSVDSIFGSPQARAA